MYHANLEVVDFCLWIVLLIRRNWHLDNISRPLLSHNFRKYMPVTGLIALRPLLFLKADRLSEK